MTAQEMLAQMKSRPRSTASWSDRRAAREADYNAKPGKLIGYDCPDCLNRGDFLRHEGTYAIYHPCKCMAIRKSLKELEKSGLKELYEYCTFAGFEADEQWQKDMKATVLRYVSQPSGHWLYLCGQVGAGKTHLCVAAAAQFLKQGMSARYMLWRDEIVRIKANTTDDDEYQRLVDPLKTVKVLYIDDFFKCEKGSRPTPADVNIAFEILNHRYIHRDLVTILSSEWTVDELLSFDEAVGSRIYSRAKGYCFEIGRDRRRNYRLGGAV